MIAVVDPEEFEKLFAEVRMQKLLTLLNNWFIQTSHKNF